MPSEYSYATAPPAATAAGEVNQAPYILFQTRSTPVPLKFTWSKQAVYPCKLGIRKDIYALGALLRFRAKADILIPSGRFIYGFSARDTIFHGRFNVNVPARIVAYSKNVTLPNGMNVTVSAGSQYIGPGHGSSFKSRFKPLCGFQIGFAGGQEGNVIYSEHGLTMRQAVPLPLHLLGIKYPRLDLETYTSIKIPQMGSRGHGADGSARRTRAHPVRTVNGRHSPRRRGNAEPADPGNDCAVASRRGTPAAAPGRSQGDGCRRGRFWRG